MIFPRLALALAAVASPLACTPADPALGPDDEPIVDAAPLAPNEVASIGGEGITFAELDRYISVLYARQPFGEETLRQIVTERIVAERAAELGVTVDDAMIDAGLSRLDAQSRAESGQGLSDTLDAAVDDDALREGMATLMALDAVVRVETGTADDAPLDPVALNEWLAPRLDAAAIEERPLDDAIAATWSGGEIPRAEVGRRLRGVLPHEDVVGIVSEMIGIVLVREEARRRDIELTPAAATAEILERDALLKRHEELKDTSYEEFVRATQKRSLAELLSSEKFATEVLLRLFVEADYDADAIRAFHDAERALFVERHGDAPFEDIEHLVRKELRERTYRDLYEKATIQRRL